LRDEKCIYRDDEFDPCEEGGAKIQSVKAIVVVYGRAC
jgi:hypothetical protein